MNKKEIIAMLLRTKAKSNIGSFMVMLAISMIYES